MMNIVLIWFSPIFTTNFRGRTEYLEINCYTEVSSFVLKTSMDSRAHRIEPNKLDVPVLKR